MRYKRNIVAAIAITLALVMTPFAVAEEPAAEADAEEPAAEEPAADEAAAETSEES